MYAASVYLLKLITVAALGIAAILAFGADKYSRAAYEFPPHEILKSDGAFEVRPYPIHDGSVHRDGHRAEGGSFMRLFRYISGSNENDEKISMTTPVFMSQGPDGRMSFVVPQAAADRGAPRAESAEVTIEALEGGRFAPLPVFRIVGYGSISRVREDPVGLVRDLSPVATSLPPL